MRKALAGIHGAIWKLQGIAITSRSKTKRNISKLSSIWDSSEIVLYGLDVDMMYQRNQGFPSQNRHVD